MSGEGDLDPPWLRGAREAQADPGVQGGQETVLRETPPFPLSKPQTSCLPPGCPRPPSCARAGSRRVYIDGFFQCSWLVIHCVRLGPPVTCSRPQARPGGGRAGPPRPHPAPGLGSGAASTQTDHPAEGGESMGGALGLKVRPASGQPSRWQPPPPSSPPIPAPEGPVCGPPGHTPRPSDPKHCHWLSPNSERSKIRFQSLFLSVGPLCLRAPHLLTEGWT